MRALLGGFDDVELSFVGGRYARLQHATVRPRPRVQRRQAVVSLTEGRAPRDVGLVDHVAVALDVAVLAAHDEDDEIVRLARVRHPARGRRVDVEEPARSEDPLLALDDRLAPRP